MPGASHFLLTASILLLNGPVSIAQQWDVHDMSNSPLPSTTVNALAEDGEGGVWIGTDWGLAHFDGEVGWEVFQVDNSGITSNFITALALDSADGIWVGTQADGLLRWDGNTWVGFTTANSPIPENEIRGLFIDHRNWVWITTAGGMGVFTGSEWYRYDSTDESHAGLALNTSSTNCVAVRGDGTICLGTINGGLHFLTDTSVFFLTIPQDGFFDNTATDVLFDPVSGDRWVATPSAGLLRQQGPTFGGVWFQWGIAIGFPSNGISAIDMDPQRRVWAATQATGVVRIDLDGGHVVYDVANSGLPDNETRTILTAQDGSVWVGTTYGGLARYRETIGIRGPGPYLAIRVFPNPASDHWRVEIDEQVNRHSWTLMSTDGRIVGSGSDAGPSVLIQVAGLASGPYFLSLEVDGIAVQKRVQVR